MSPTPPDYTPDGDAIVRAGLVVTTAGAAFTVLWVGVRRIHRFVGRAAFKPELALVAKIPDLEADMATLKEAADQFRELLDMSRQTQTQIQQVSGDVKAMRQEHADGMTTLNDRVTDLAREVSEVRGEMKGRDAAYDRRRTT